MASKKDVSQVKTATAVGSLLRVRDVSVTFGSRGSHEPVRALTHVDLDVGRHGEIVGVVGESGSGKSTLGKVILGEVPLDEGTVEYDGEDITHASSRRRRQLASELQVVFQDPYGSLNPARTIGQSLGEPLTALSRRSSKDVRAEVAAALDLVGMPARAAELYPRQFSGGQKQRIVIARAIINRPRLLICDEAVSALDLSVQAQILNLLTGLRDELGLSMVFIGHGLETVRHVSDRMVVLYRGEVMEAGNSDALWSNPRHPYTRSLIEASPVPDPRTQRERRDRRRSLALTVLGTGSTGVGCVFAPRCPHVLEVCRTETPAAVPVSEQHLAACHRALDPDVPSL